MSTDRITIIEQVALNPESMPLPFFWQNGSGLRGIRSEGRALGGDLLVFIWKDCMQVLLEHARSSPRHEIGGLLLGRYCHDGQQQFVIVERGLPTPDTGSLIEFRFTSSAVEQVDVEHHSKYPELQRLGWYHSHPIGLRLSDPDLDIHRRIFRAPHHIAIVMMTGGKEIGCAAWEQGQVGEVGGFFVLEAEGSVKGERKGR